MLFAATPEQKIPGVPPMAVFERNMAGSGMGKFDMSILTDLIKPASETGLQLLGSRYGVPQLQPGTVIQQTPQGSLMLAQPAGVPVQQPYPVSTRTEFDTNLGTGVLIAGAAVMVVVVMLVMNKNKGGKG